VILHRSIALRRTLVIHTGGIGDFLLFCPALKRLAEDGPVELAGNDRDRLNLAVVAGIAENARLLDDFDFGSVFTTPSTQFTRFVAKFDRVIIWMADEDQRIRNALANAGVQDARVHPGLPPKDWNAHASAYYASALGLEDLPPLVLPFESDGFKHDVVIHPGSGAARKNWPMDRFIALADVLQSRGRNVAWIRGPAEEQMKLPATARTIEGASLVTLARHLTGTAQYVGNDSGVTHLAAACGCKTVAIFRDTDAAVWAPRGDSVTVVQEDIWPGIDVVLKSFSS